MEMEHRYFSGVLAIGRTESEVSKDEEKKKRSTE